MDERGHAVEGGYLSMLSDVLGISVVDIAPLAVTSDSRGLVEPLVPGIDRISAAVATPATQRTVHLRDPHLRTWPGTGHSWTEQVLVLDDQTHVVAEFAEADVAGQPAVTVRRVEDHGDAWYVATDLDPTGRQHVLDAVLRGTRIAVGTPLPAGVSLTRRGPITFVLNHSDEPAAVTGLVGARAEDGAPLPAQGVLVPARGAVLVRTSADSPRTTTIHTIAPGGTE